MMDAIIETYDHYLEKLFGPLAYKRDSLGVYVRAGDSEVWYGLWVVFESDQDRTIVQPNLSVFCPMVGKIKQKAFSVLYGATTALPKSRLSSPIVTTPLYTRVRSRLKQERHSYSYFVSTDDAVQTSTRLLVGDFVAVADEYFASISSMRGLLDYIMSHRGSTSAGIDAMILGYLLDGKLSPDQIGGFVKLSPNEMTKEFAAYFVNRIAEDGAG